MTTLSHKRSGFGESMKRRAKALDTMTDVHGKALEVIERQNADISFSLDHRHTVVTVEDDRIAVGTVSETYAELMHMDGAEVAKVYSEHLDD